MKLNEFINETVTSRKNYDEWRNEVLKTICETLDFPVEKMFVHRREKQKGKSQYRKQDNSGELQVVHEGGLKFLVNLTDYLDTGL